MNKISYIIEFNDYLKNNNFKNLIEIINEIYKINSIPIILFKLIISKNKLGIKENLNNIKEEKINLINYFKKINFSNFEEKDKIKFAIQIKLENYDNLNISYINNLKKDFDLIIGLGGLNKQNRFFLEQTQIDFLQDPQNSYFKSKIDFIHHLNSGLNQVLLTFAKEKKIGLIFTLNFTNKLNSYLLSKEIGRINQNIKLTRKYEIPIYINYLITNRYQIKTNKQIENIYSLFDISTIQKIGIYSLTNKILKNGKKQDKNYISEYIKIIN